MAKATGHGGRDYPDYLQGALPHENPVEITRAELAIRLGFNNVFERTGNVLWYETFENGMGDWFKGANGPANIPVLSSRGLLNSPYSALLQITFSDTSYSSIAKYVAYPYITTFGLEVSFRPLSVFGTLMFGYQIYTGAIRYSVWIRYNCVTSIWELYDENGDWQTIGTYDLGTSDISVWHTAKVVVDMVNLRYARLSYDAVDNAIAQYGVESVASTIRPGLELSMSLGEVTSNIGSVCIDNVILTMNEPI